MNEWLALLNTAGLLGVALANGLTAYLAWRVRAKIEKVAATVEVSAPLIKETAAIVREQPTTGDVVSIVKNGGINK